MLSDKKVLVTGCAGFLGSWVCRLLLELGIEVIGIDRAYPAASLIHELKGRMPLREIDIENYDECYKVVIAERINVIFHLAAQAIVSVANVNPLATFASNITGSANILEAARLATAKGQKIEAIIVASSDKAYGDQISLPYLEDAPMQGRFPYDVSKSCTDLIARSYHHSFRLPVCVTRCGNLYGPGDLHLTRLVPSTILSVLRDERPILRSDGTPLRDYIYVQDAALAAISLASRMIEDSDIHGQAFNVSNERPVSVLELVNLICNLMEKPELEPVIEGRAEGEIQAQYLCSDKIRTLLGWAPEFQLEDGLSRAIAWYRQKTTVKL